MDQEEKKKLERSFDDEKWEADSVIEEATGLAQALYDQIDTLIRPIVRLEKYTDVSDEQKSLVTQTVVTRRKALTTLSGALLDKLADAHQKLQ